MKTLSRSAALFSLTVLAVSAHAKIITVTTENNVSPPANQTSLLQAINLLADGDTIQFSIPGSGVHYINTPPGGYPLVTANRVTIDGYSQPGAVPNSNPIHAPNNAQLKIVLSSTNGNAMSMGASIAAYTGFTYSNLGFGSDELAILGFFRATNVLVKGLAIVSDVSGTDGVNSGDMKTISFCPDSAEQGGANCGNWQVSGCWFGLNPATGQLAYMPDNSTVATPTICIAAYRTRDNSGANARFAQPGTIGVAAGSTNPRAEFNVFITGYGFDSEGLNYRISGNFWDVLPDGMHNVDVSIVNNHILKGDAYIEIGRSYDNITIGTDGDGVNDAEEGNVFGGYANGGDVIDLYGSSSGTNFVIAGNYFSVAIDGTTRFDNSGLMVNTFDSTAAVRFGSDFDGVSDAWEANRVYNFTNASDLFFEGDCRVMLPPCASLNPGIRLSFRGNITVNNELVPYSYAKSDGTCLICFTNYEALYMDTNSDVIPNLNTNSAYPRLKGTFAPGIAPYTNIFIDVYQLDQEGWTNGMALMYFDTYNNGFAQGSKYFASFTVSNTGAFDIDLTGKTTTLGPLTVTVNYSADPPGTHNGRVHTSNFSSPATLIPGGAESVGLTHIVPDTLFWFDSAAGRPRLGGYNTATAIPFGGSLEPYAGLLGDSTFLLSANNYAADGVSMRFTSILQPAGGGAAKIDDLFYDDSGKPYTNQINGSRQDGNPGRVAGDPRYGSINFMGGGEASLYAFPSISGSAFNSDGRFNPTLALYTYMEANLSGPARDACVQTYSLAPLTLAQTMLSKAEDSAFGRLWANQTPPTGASADQLSRFGGHIQGLDNGDFVSVVEDRSSFYNASGHASVATIFHPDGSIVKEAFKVADADQWANVAAYRGGFAVRPSGGLIYFFDNAGNLQGSVDHNATSGLVYDTGRGDGTRTASDIRSHYLYMAGVAGGQVWLSVWNAQTRAFVTKAVVDEAASGLDRVNLAVDALDRVCVVYKVEPTADFTLFQTAARVLAFDGANLTYLTPSFFPLLNHDSQGTLLTRSDEPSVAMTTRQIFISAKGAFNSTNNPSAGTDTAYPTDIYTVISHPSPIAAPQPQMTVSRSGANVTISWQVDAGLFTVQKAASLAPSVTWSDVTTGNVPPPVNVSIGADPSFFRLVRHW